MGYKTPYRCDYFQIKKPNIKQNGVWFFYVYNFTPQIYNNLGNQPNKLTHLTFEYVLC